MKLNHMTNDFPGLAEWGAGYQNEFDYSRYDANVTATLYYVLWDSTNANLPVFDDAGSRDSYFSEHSGVKISLTLERRILIEDSLKVPLPFDVAAKYNYMSISFSEVTSSSNPVDYESSDGYTTWFYFIDDIEYKAVNTTELKIVRDDWVTFSNDVTFTYGKLERGHYPVSMSNVSDYLANPIDNSRYLMTPDVSFATPYVVTDVAREVLNDTVSYVCFACTSDPTSSDWTSDTYVCPASEHTDVYGQPSQFVFGVPKGSYQTFLSSIDSTYPQFKQTVQAVFLAPDKLISLGSSFTFCSVTCYQLNTFYQYSNELIDFSEADFGYADEYKGFAKLYTYPYACVTITDGCGNTREIHIEETSGTLETRAAMSFAAPIIGVSSYINGLGASGYDTVSFQSLTSNSVGMGGNWFDVILEWNVPTFAIVQDAYTYNYFSEFFNREQAVTAYTNAYEAACNSAETAQENAVANATTALANTNASALTTKTNAYTSADATKTIAYENAATAKENAYTSASATKTIAYNTASNTKTTSDNTASATKTIAYESASAAYGNACNTALANQKISYESASTAQTNANASALAVYNNACASASTAQTNSNSIAYTTYDNTLVSSNAVKNNSDLQATTSQTIAENNADLIVTNTDNQIDCNDMNNSLAIASNETCVSNSNTASTYITSIANAVISDNYSYDATLTYALVDADAEATYASTAVNTVSNVVSAVSSGAMSGGIGGAVAGLISGAISGVTSGANSVITVDASYTKAAASVSNASSKASVSETYNSAANTYQVNAQASNCTAMNAAATNQTNTTNAMLEANAQNQHDNADANALIEYTCATTINATNYDVALANAERTYDTAVDCAANTYSTATANALRTYNAAVNNAQRTYDTSITNADEAYSNACSVALVSYNAATANADTAYSNSTTNNALSYSTAISNADAAYTASIAVADNAYDCAIDNADTSYTASTTVADATYETTCANAERTYDNAIAVAANTYDTAIENADLSKATGVSALNNEIADYYTQAPMVFGGYTGTKDLVLKPMMVQATVTTQPASAIAQAGDYFARFGYAYEGNVNITDWQVMNHYTYWQFNDVYCYNGNGVMCNVVKHLKNILCNGVTLWSDPDEIGKVSIYDN